VYELLTTEILKLRGFIFEEDRWWEAMKEQWLYLDDQAWNEIVHVVQEGAMQLIGELQTEAAAHHLEVLTEGIISGLFSLVKKIVVAMFAAIFGATSREQGTDGRIYLVRDQRRRSLLVRLNSSIANMTAAQCLTHSMQAEQTAKKNPNGGQTEPDDAEPSDDVEPTDDIESPDDEAAANDPLVVDDDNP
ncbi:MAG TPA: hypothetical protein PK867_26300, partial [Pirellulales bacterium]|nr:hypothetical protein [Pirellulales bacterium]